MTKESIVGQRIRKYRQGLEMSVAELSARSGVEEKLLYAIEAGDVLPALGILTKLSRALGQRLGTFMDDQFKADPIITRSADLDAPPETGAGVGAYSSRSLALGKPDRHMDPFKIDFPANGEHEESSHEGEELIICKTGRVELKYGGETFVLKPGDTAYYNSVVKHSLKAAGSEPASIYGIVFMPF